MLTVFITYGSQINVHKSKKNHIRTQFLYPNNGSNLAGALGLEPRAYGFGDDADKSASGELPFEVNISTIQKEIAAISAKSYQKTKQIGNFRNKPTVF